MTSPAQMSQMREYKHLDIAEECFHRFIEHSSIRNSPVVLCYSTIDHLLKDGLVVIGLTADPQIPEIDFRHALKPRIAKVLRVSVFLEF